jgi:hypothetical protein
VMALEGSRMLQFCLTAFDSDGDGATLLLVAFDSAVFDSDDAKRGRKKIGAAKRKRERERNEEENGGERKYSCLMNEEGIVIVKFEVLLFIVLTFLLK